MKTKSVSIIAVGLIALSQLFTGCTKDMYDSEYKGNKDDNPLGISAPESFDWSSFSTARVVISVDDKFIGKYDYLVEIYDNNPLYNSDAHLLGVGVSKQGQPYTGEISFPQVSERFFVKQTDPRGRVSVKSFATTENGGTINCDFSSFSNKALTRANSENSIPEHTYTVADIPADAIEIKGADDNNCLSNQKTKNFKITGNYTGGIYHYSGKDIKLFVSGTWTIPASEETAYWSYAINQGLDIIVLPGGKIIAQGENKTLSFKTSSSLIVMNDAEVTLEGSLEFTNNGYLYNKGIVEIGEDFTMQSNSGFYNFCTVKIDDLLYANAANSIFYQDKGTVVAEKIVFNNMEISLLNGSMIKATEEIDQMSQTSYYAEGTNTSLVKSPEIKCTSNVLYSGNMVVESDEHSSDKRYELENGASMAKYNQSEVVIEACDGTTENPGNPGGEPENPKYPIIIDTTGDDYIYSMEDSWPSYGDYDMNDAVVKLSKSKIALYADNSKAITYRVKVIAIGAIRRIAAAIQFDKIASNQIKGVTYKNTQAIQGFRLNSQNCEEGQDLAVIPFFSNAKDFIGQNSNINVGESGIEIAEESLPVQEITIEFASSVKDENLNVRNINFFITNNGTDEGRTEIHLAGYEPTNLANMDLFGVNDDNSIEGKYKYISKESNLAWGLIIPTGDWKCPQEGINILTVYPDFKNWVVSGGIENKDWYIKK